MEREVIEMVVSSSTLARLDKAQGRLEGLRKGFRELIGASQTNRLAVSDRLCAILGPLSTYAAKPSQWTLVGWALVSSLLAGFPVDMLQAVVGCLSIMPVTPLDRQLAVAALYRGLRRGRVEYLWSLRSYLAEHVDIGIDVDRRFIAGLLRSVADPRVWQEMDRIIENRVRRKHGCLLTPDIARFIVASNCALGMPSLTAVWVYLCLRLDAEHDTDQAVLFVELAEELLGHCTALHGLPAWGRAMECVAMVLEQ